MTAGNNGGAGGAGKPEDDDPFAYLYRSEDGEGGADGGTAAPQPGVPRTSYNQVRPVGSRQYGAPQGGGTYGGQAPGGTYGGHQPMPGHQPAPHYAAPETLPGGAPRQPMPGGGGPVHDGGRPKRRGLLIGAIAVVLVVAGGIGAAMLTNDDSDSKSNKVNTADGTNKPSPPPSDKSKDKKKGSDASKNPSAEGELKRDAATLKLSGGATTAKDVKGANADGGTYVSMRPGGTVEWKVDVPRAGDYTVFVNYGVPGTDTTATLSVNGKALDYPVKLKNHSHAASGDWANGWTHTYNFVQLDSGTNVIKLSCGQGSQFNLDQLQLRPGQVQ